MCMNSRYGPGAITFEFAQVSAVFQRRLKWGNVLCAFRPLSSDQIGTPVTHISIACDGLAGIC